MRALETVMAFAALAVLLGSSFTLMRTSSGYAALCLVIAFVATLTLVESWRARARWRRVALPPD